MPIATGILIDKYRQFEGEPTQTIEVRKTVTLDDVKGELDRINRVANVRTLSGILGRN